MEQLFKRFDEQLWQSGLIPQGGQIIDASLVNVPKNRNKRDENKQIKEGKGSDASIAHARNFLDCMRTREEPNADVEIGHRSTTMSLIANISLAVGQRLEWDADAERFTNSQAANELLHYEYRKPWKLG